MAVYVSRNRVSALLRYGGFEGEDHDINIEEIIGNITLISLYELSFTNGLIRLLNDLKSSIRTLSMDSVISFYNFR